MISVVISQEDKMACERPLKARDETNEVLEDPAFESLASSKALTNPLIVLKILQNVRTADLLNCRLMNVDWKNLSTELLLKWNSSEVRLVKLKGSSEFNLCRNIRLGLKDLTTLISTSDAFPSCSLSFDGELNSSDVTDFLKHHGHMIKDIKLQGRLDYVFAINLLGGLPSLSALTLGNIVSYPAKCPNLPSGYPTTFDQRLSLLSLKSIIMEGTSCKNDMLEKLVKSAPNLTSCTGYWNIAATKVLLNRMHILKEFILIPYSDQISDVQEIAGKVSNLDKLSINFRYLFEDNAYEFETPSLKILTSSRSTLKQLRFNIWDELPFVLQVPKLEHLSELEIEVDCSTWLATEQLFYLSEHNFPNLHVVSLKSCGSYDKQNRFPLKGCAPSVRALDVEGPFTISIEILEMFPRLENLRITDLQNFIVTGKIIWKMKSLKKLELGLRSEGRNTCLEVDKTFTGFSEDTVLKLYQLSGDSTLEWSYLDNIRINPSILDLTNLRELSLVNGFRKNCAEWYVLHPVSPTDKGISQVSKKWAIDMMPNLRFIDQED